MTYLTGEGEIGNHPVYPVSIFMKFIEVKIIINNEIDNQSGTNTD
jgi:hypothetical protein